MVRGLMFIFALLLMCLVLVESKISFGPIYAREKVVKAGEPFDFVIRAHKPIKSCHVIFSNGEIKGLQYNTKMEDCEYLGSGFRYGDCGIRYYAIKPEQHGKVTFIVIYNEIQYPRRERESWFTNLIVAEPPTDIELSASEEDVEGEEMHISCQAKGGRPAPSVTLILDNVTLATSQRSQDTVNYTKTNITIKDNGKEVICRVTHVAMDEPKFLQRKLVVLFKPRPSIQKFSLREGKEGVITVEMLANPEPSLEWKINGEDPAVYNYSDSSRIRQNEETGFWLAELRIPNVTKEDADKEIELTASNEYGSQIYMIEIVLEPHAIIPDGLGPADLVAGIAVIGLALVTYIFFTIALLLSIIIPSAALLRDAE